MLDLCLFIVLVILATTGLRHPAIAYAGYVWADILSPQGLAFGFASTIQYSLIMAGVCAVSMAINHKKLTKPTSTALFLMILVFIVWFNLTTGWATNPESAAFKLDWAMKSMGFTLIAFLIINNRQTLELYLMTFVSCTAYFAFQTGIKTLMGGAAYGQELVYGGNNSGLTESSTLGGVAVACIPFIIYFSKHSQLFKADKWLSPVCYLTIAIFLLAVVGTHSRTGLVCIGLLVVFSIMFAKHRFALLMLTLICGLLLYVVAGADWRTRMSTISNAQEESSAASRLIVWAWTIEYTKSHPLGAGFEAYRDNAGQLLGYVPATVGDVEVKQTAVAYHNVFIEVLGEQGYPGLIMYLTIMLITLRKIQVARRPIPHLNSDGIEQDNEAWIRAGATACLMGFSCMLLAGMFIGVAYRPYLFIFAIAASVFARERQQRVNAIEERVGVR